MSDTKISALTAAASMAAANEFPINEAGTSKKVTGQQIADYIADTIRNTSTADQTISAATAYVTGSNLSMPTNKLRIGTVLRWRLVVTKTAAGTTAGCAIIVKLGTLGTTSDTSVLTFTFGTPTGAVDTAFFDVEVVCRGPLTASGVLVGGARMTHNLAATGFSTLPGEAIAVVSSTFDVTTASLIAGLTITTTALSAWTIKSVTAEAKYL
jgi:hypothetical protein